MPDLQTEILEIIAGGAAWEVEQLRYQLRVRLDAAVETPVLHEALSHLERQKRIEHNRSRATVTRCEPDWPESDLYPSIERFLISRAARTELHIGEDTYVFQDTTQGGPRGGTWSQPDFTLAAIRSWDFDPRRYLDVFSFEVKNAKGAGVVGVYEAHAHGRFVHFPYFVCPRLTVRHEVQALVERECAALGVGLVQFDLVGDQDGRPLLTNFTFEMRAQRRATDPQNVDQFLEDRLTADKAATLKRMARQS